MSGRRLTEEEVAEFVERQKAVGQARYRAGVNSQGCGFADQKREGVLCGSEG